jgi:lipopolysaccharide export system protein LptA
MICWLLASYLLVAEKADFNGERLLLNGNFSIDHKLGHLSAEKAILTHPPLKKNTHKTPTLELEQGVRISLQEGSLPFLITSQKAYSELAPDSPLSFFDLQFIEFQGDVEISQPNGMKATGGNAVYEKNLAILYPTAPQARCRLQLGNDQVDATRVSFNLKNEELTCLKPIGSLARSPVRFHADSLTWRRKKGEVEFNGSVHIEHIGQMSAESDFGLLTYPEEFEPDFLYLKGNVKLLSSRIQDKESFALADELTYRPKEKIFVLSANAPKKVLFWQNDIRISASEVHIRRDRKTGSESVEGVGDVHFAFDLEEENILREFFGKLL